LIEKYFYFHQNLALKSTLHVTKKKHHIKSSSKKKEINKKNSNSYVKFEFH